MATYKVEVEMLNQRKNRADQPVRTNRGSRKLHSMHGVLRGRVIDGRIEANDQAFRYSYAPATASIVERKLVLSGRFAVDSPRNGIRFVDGVEARLVATQGGVGVSPVRRQLLTGTVQTAQTATPEQRMEQQSGPETELQPGLHAFENPRFDALGRPVVESTGELSFVGTLYFSLTPLDAQALGVPLDLSNVQLNARLATTDDLGRDLQMTVSDLVAALYGDQIEESEAEKQLKHLNRFFTR
jgi:hypothetical protein